MRHLEMNVELFSPLKAGQAVSGGGQRRQGRNENAGVPPFPSIMTAVFRRCRDADSVAATSACADVAKATDAAAARLQVQLQQAGQV
jgi:hypothetical protein